LCISGKQCAESEQYYLTTKSKPNSVHVSKLDGSPVNLFGDVGWTLAAGGDNQAIVVITTDEPVVLSELILQSGGNVSSVEAVFTSSTGATEKVCTRHSHGTVNHCRITRFMVVVSPFQKVHIRTLHFIIYRFISRILYLPANFGPRGEWSMPSLCNINAHVVFMVHS